MMCRMRQHFCLVVHIGWHVQVVPCLAIFDTMKYIGSDVGTVGFGGCMGMSGFLLAVGKKVNGLQTVIFPQGNRETCCVHHSPRQK